jgi:Mg2+/Co2+ transporter CorB
MDVLLGMVVLIVIIFAYFLPATIAVVRNHRNSLPVFLVNLLFGWTFLGWAVALIWSCTNQTATARK